MFLPQCFQPLSSTLQDDYPINIKGTEQTVSEYYHAHSGPTAYLGTTVPTFPNFFTIAGACVCHFTPWLGADSGARSQHRNGTHVFTVCRRSSSGSSQCGEFLEILSLLGAIHHANDQTGPGRTYIVPGSYGRSDRKIQSPYSESTRWLCVVEMLLLVQNRGQRESARLVPGIYELVLVVVEAAELESLQGYPSRSVAF